MRDQLTDEDRSILRREYHRRAEALRDQSRIMYVIREGVNDRIDRMVLDELGPYEQQFGGVLAMQADTLDIQIDALETAADRLDRMSERTLKSLRWTNTESDKEVEDALDPR